VDLLAIVGPLTSDGITLAAEESTGGLVINFFWIIIAALNFILFYAVFRVLFQGRISAMLEARRERIERGLEDAEAARQEREASATERAETLALTRREAKEIIDRAQKVAQETRDADIAATRDELERLRVRAAAEIEAEKQRALTELRAEVADLALAAAGRVVGETMSDERQRRLVDEFLHETSDQGAKG